jgi:cobalt-zinc-cadmium efflux system membrane fusion protein
MRVPVSTFALALVMAGCSGRQAPGAAAAPPPASTPAPSAPAAAYFTVPEQQLPHLQVVPVTTATWTTILHTTGTVDWDNEHTTQAITQVSGPITRILVDTGTRVKKGDVLLYVSSPEITNAVSTYRKAKNRLDLAQRSLDRNKDLLDHKAISQREFESAQADYNDAATDVQSSLQALRIFGVSERDIADAERQNVAIRPELAMRSPIAGTIVQKMVLPGQFIQAGTTATFTISDVSTLWVQGHIYEKDLRSVHKGDTVEMRSASFPTVFHGTISYIGDMIDPGTRTTPVRIVTKNSDGLLKKDLFVDVTIQDKTSRQALVVPTTAVLYDEQNFPFVYVQMEPGKFAQRQIKIGAQRQDQTEVLDGVKEGDRVVSQGSVFLQFANTFQDQGPA